MKIKEPHTIIYKYPFLIFVFFLLLAYCPVFLPFFHLKNDVITQNLPTRFFISESLSSQTFPWWNPYINYGIPQYGDMNNGFWNPFLWITAEIFGYSVLTITLEEMFYILIGGWGIYKLIKLLKPSPYIALICGLSYMSGGFIIGHLQHFCWITGTAFFPYVLLFFLRCINQAILKNFILGGFFCFLFISSTHPGLIIGGIYFFTFLIAYLLFDAIKNKDQQKLKIIIRGSLLYIVFATVFSVIVIISNIEVLQYITRGGKISTAQTLYTPTTLQSYLSLVFPFAVNKGQLFHTDISMRNMSVGICLIPGLYLYLRKTNFKKNWILLSAFLFFVLLAAGGYFKLFAYYFLPYLGYVRLNGEFSYFPFLMLVLASSYGLANASDVEKSSVPKIFSVLQNFFIVFIVICLSAILIITKNSILFSYLKSLTDVKLMVNNFSFWDLCLLSSLLQLICIILLKKTYPNKFAYLLITIINLTFITWGCLPYTGLGDKSRREVQAIINSTAKGLHKPFQKSIKENEYINSKYDTIIGSAGFYSKQIGYATPLPYPVILKQTNQFFNDASLIKFINSQSFLFLSSDTLINSQTNFDSTFIKVTRFTPTITKVIVDNPGFQYLIFLQNNYPRWKVLLDGEPVRHFTAFKTFIGIPIPGGTHEVEFRFETRALKIILGINIFILCGALFLLTQKKIMSKKLL
jgi:hypothetical protein